jgi:hypothetical protein
MDSNEVYQKAFADAEEAAIQRAEAEVIRRSVLGVDRPVFYKGQQCGTIREFSDTLLMFHLKSKRPEVYRDRHDVRVSVDESDIDREIEEALAKLADSRQTGPTGVDSSETEGRLRVVSPPAVPEAGSVSEPDGT